MAAGRGLALAILLGALIPCLESMGSAPVASPLDTRCFDNYRSLSVGDCSMWKVADEEGNLVATCLHAGRPASTGKGMKSDLESAVRLATCQDEAGEGQERRNAGGKGKEEEEEEEVEEKIGTGEGLAEGGGHARILLCWAEDDTATSRLKCEVCDVCDRLGLKFRLYGAGAAKRNQCVFGISTEALPDAIVSEASKFLPDRMTLAGSSIIMGILDRSTTLTELIVRVSTRHRTSDVEVTVVDKGEDADSWIRDKVVGANLGSMLLGVDMEWKPNFCKGEDQNPVSLIQVSFVDQVLLAQIMHMIPGGMPPLLASLMSHPSVRKVGVGLNEDAVKLKRDWNQQLRGRVELAKFAESTPLWDDSGRSLAAITQSVLGIKLCKSKKIRMGNWGAKSLSASQAVYAAMDAWVGSEALSLLEKAVGRRAPSDSSLVTDSKGSRDTKDAKHYVVTVGGTASIYADLDFAASRVADSPGANVRVFVSQQSAEDYVAEVRRTAANAGSSRGQAPNQETQVQGGGARRGRAAPLTPGLSRSHVMPLKKSQ